MTARKPRPALTAQDYAIAEEVIGAWCENGDKRTTRALIAEGAARARIATLTLDPPKRKPRRHRK